MLFIFKKLSCIDTTIFIIFCSLKILIIIKLAFINQLIICIKFPKLSFIIFTDSFKYYLSFSIKNSSISIKLFFIPITIIPPSFSKPIFTFSSFSITKCTFKLFYSIRILNPLFYFVQKHLSFKNFNIIWRVKNSKAMLFTIDILTFISMSIFKHFNTKSMFNKFN